MNLCALKQILYKKKAILIQLLESPIPPFTAPALWMVICKWQAPPFDSHEKCIFEILHHEIECVLRPSPIKVKTNDNKPIKCLSSFAIATMNIFIALFFLLFLGGGPRTFLRDEDKKPSFLRLKSQIKGTGLATQTS